MLGVGALHNFYPAAGGSVIGNSLPLETPAFKQVLQRRVNLELPCGFILVVIKAQSDDLTVHVFPYVLERLIYE